MKTAEVQLSDPIYCEFEKLASELRLTVPELLQRTAEQLVQSKNGSKPTREVDWRFPEARHLGTFRAPVHDWRLLASEMPINGR